MPHAGKVRLPFESLPNGGQTGSPAHGVALPCRLQWHFSFATALSRLPGRRAQRSWWPASALYRSSARPSIVRCVSGRCAPRLAGSLQSAQQCNRTWSSHRVSPVERTTRLDGAWTARLAHRHLLNCCNHAALVPRPVHSIPFLPTVGAAGLTGRRNPLQGRKSLELITQALQNNS